MEDVPQADLVPQFLKLQKYGLGREARSFRLKQGDVLVAIDGNLFTGDTAMLRAVFDSAGQESENDETEGAEDDEPSKRFLLTFWREGRFFHLVFSSPLVGRFDFTSAEESLTVIEGFKSLRLGPLENYVNFEVFKDIYRNAGIHSLTEDPLAALVPFLWMLNHRLYYPMIGIALVYAITFLTHWALFVAVYLLVCIYTKRAQFNLLRSYQLFEEKYFWMVLAETSEIEARESARKFDPDLRFAGEKARRRKKKSPARDGSTAGSSVSS